jgi:hypothetical protein
MKTFLYKIVLDHFFLRTFITGSRLSQFSQNCMLDYRYVEMLFYDSFSVTRLYSAEKYYGVNEYELTFVSYHTFTLRVLNYAQADAYKCYS